MADLALSEKIQRLAQAEAEASGLALAIELR
jgi:hypothetical protein